MIDYHPYNPAYCVSCHNPDGRGWPGGPGHVEREECTGVKASDIDLNRVVSDKALADIREVVGVTHQPGITVADLIRAEAGIGYGGHFDETSDDEDTVFAIAAVDDRELNGMHAARVEYVAGLRDAVDAYTWPPQQGACGEILYEGGGWPVSVCRMPFGTEHSHSDLSAREAIEAGVASALSDGSHPAVVSVLGVELAEIRLTGLEPLSGQLGDADHE